MITLAQLNGPMWAVGGETVEVPAGADAARFLIDYATAGAGGEDAILVRPIGQEPFTLTLQADGAITTDVVTDPRVLAWLRLATRSGSDEWPASARAVDAPVSSGWNLYGAHPGAGATTWAELLDGTELTDLTAADGRILVATRTTLRGIEAAKSLTHRAGALLLVADAPGSVPADVRRGIRVLSGAAPIVRVPWLPPLRGTLTISHTSTVTKAAAKINAAIRATWKDTP